MNLLIEVLGEGLNNYAIKKELFLGNRYRANLMSFKLMTQFVAVLS